MANGTPSYYPGLAQRFKPMLPGVGKIMEMQQQQKALQQEREFEAAQASKERNAKFFEKMATRDFKELVPELNQMIVRQSDDVINRLAEITQNANRQSRDYTVQEKAEIMRLKGRVDGNSAAFKKFQDTWIDYGEMINKNEDGIFDEKNAKAAMAELLQSVENPDGTPNYDALSQEAIENTVWQPENMNFANYADIFAEKVDEMEAAQKGTFDDHYEKKEWKTKLVRYKTDENGDRVPMINEDTGLPVFNDTPEALRFARQDPMMSRAIDLKLQELQQENPNATPRDAYREIMRPHMYVKSDFQIYSRRKSDGGDGEDQMTKAGTRVETVTRITGLNRDIDEALLNTIKDPESGIVDAQYRRPIPTIDERFSPSIDVPGPLKGPEPVEEYKPPKPTHFKLKLRKASDADAAWESIEGTEPYGITSEDVGNNVKELTFPIKTKREKQAASYVLNTLINKMDRAEFEVGTDQFVRELDKYLNQKGNNGQRQQQSNTGSTKDERGWAELLP